MNLLKLENLKIRKSGLPPLRLSLTVFASVAFFCPSFVAGQRAFDVAAFDRVRVLKAANRYLQEAPITITASTSPRSAGGLHDFFSEGDYWWPDPNNPAGPYIQRAGMTNPNNFVDHRRYLMRLSEVCGTLASAYVLTRDERYARQAIKHLKAWFVDEDTKMT